MTGPLVRRLVLAIAVITIATGLVQALAPAFMLRIIGGEATPTSAHFFGIVGMFMVLFGGALWQGMRQPVPDLTVLLWTGLQKLGASIAVGLGVAHAIFSPLALALAVAGFDLLSAALILATWNAYRAHGAPARAAA